MTVEIGKNLMVVAIIAIVAVGAVAYFTGFRVSTPTSTTTTTPKTTPHYYSNLSVENVFFVSSTNVTMYIRNSGNGTGTVYQVYVKDPNANSCSPTSSNWSIPANSYTAIPIILNSSCAFRFQHGYTYTFTVDDSSGLLSTSWTF